SSVHALLSLQSRGPPGWHEPPPQTSPTVHALPSLQGAVFGVYTAPVAGSHVSSVQGLPSSALMGVPLQEPPLHTSPEVHALLSVQGAVSGLFRHLFHTPPSPVPGLPPSQHGGLHPPVPSPA